MIIILLFFPLRITFLLLILPAFLCDSPLIRMLFLLVYFSWSIIFVLTASPSSQYFVFFLFAIEPSVYSHKFFICFSNAEWDPCRCILMIFAFANICSVRNQLFDIFYLLLCVLIVIVLVRKNKSCTQKIWRKKNNRKINIDYGSVALVLSSPGIFPAILKSILDNTWKNCSKFGLNNPIQWWFLKYKIPLVVCF